MTSTEIREAESLKAAVIAVAPDAIVISRGDGRIAEFNPAAERLFGLSAPQAADLFMSDLIVVPYAAEPSAAEACARTDANVLGSLGERVDIEARRGDGTTFPAEISILRVHVEDRTSYVAYVRDLTADRQAAAAIEAQRRRLTQVEKLSAMGSLLAGVAHELNNPLAILVAQSTVLRDKAPTPDIERRAERIHAAALRAGQIVKSFLAMAQHKAPVPEPLDLNAVVEDALRFVAYGLRSSGITILRRLDPGLPTIRADRDLVGQVFASLLVNAQQALAERADDRMIEIRSFSRQDAVVIDVEDNGSGVAPDLAERIFDPYFTTKAAGSATGVGLSLCRAVLASHGGSIGLHRGAAGGALFRVTLPRGEDASSDIGAAGPEPAAGLSILVVDDERDVAESLGELIELFGHRVLVETSAAAALGRITEGAFDMVFSDYHMPGLDGLAFRRAIGALDGRLASRTVLMTGDTVSRASRDDLSIEAQGFVLEKPFTAADVRDLLDRVNRR